MDHGVVAPHAPFSVMAYSPTYDPWGASTDARAPDEYWQVVEKLGIHDLVRLADGPDSIGKTADGRYIRVPNPLPYSEEQRVRALFILTAHCRRWYN